jgi:hypothetical protein
MTGYTQSISLPFVVALTHWRTDDYHQQDFNEASMKKQTQSTNEKLKSYTGMAKDSVIQSPSTQH